MQTIPSLPEKPIAEVFHPEITRLPRLTFTRKIIRWLLIFLIRLVVGLLVRKRVSGLEYFPRQGPALLVVNHLGDADAVIGLAVTPIPFDGLAKAELYDFPIIGKLMEVYGVIWVHRGRPDRRALRAALDGLKEGRVVAIAPEGRESLTGGLEKGTHGAAYLALIANVPIVPVTFIGTENTRIYTNLKRFRRSRISITVGPAFRLTKRVNLHKSIYLGTDHIMHILARQLPEAYRGVYQEKLNGIEDD